MTKYLTLMLIGTLGAGIASVANAQAVFSDNFSSVNSNGNSSYRTYTTGQTLTGDVNLWTVYGVSVDAVGSNLGYPTLPVAPSTWIDLAGTPGPGGIQTSLTGLTAGNTYTVNFDAMNDSGDTFYTSLGSTSDNIAGTLVAVPENSTWSSYSESFVAASGTNYLDFYSSSANTGNIGVTDVQVVPEPVPTALAGIATIFGFMAIKRRNA